MADRHRLAELRSLALHREVARRVASDPKVLEAARARVARWIASGDVPERYARSWQQILELPVERICQILVDPEEEARALRQVTPFAGAVDPRTRWRIWKEAAAEAADGSKERSKAGST